MSTQLKNLKKHSKVAIEEVLTSENLYIEELTPSSKSSIEEICSSDIIHTEDSRIYQQVSSESNDDISLSDVFSKSSLHRQIINLKNDMSSIQNRIDSQLQFLKSAQYTETEKIEDRIRAKLTQLSSSRPNKSLPTCCNSICIIH